MSHTWWWIIGVPLGLILLFIVVRIIASATFISFWKTKRQFEKEEKDYGSKKHWN